MCGESWLATKDLGCGLDVDDTRIIIATCKLLLGSACQLLITA